MKTTIVFLVIWYYGGQPFNAEYRSGATSWQNCIAASKYLAKTQGAFEVACIKVPQ